MSDHLEALRDAFGASPAATAEPAIGHKALAEARRAIDEARGQLTLVTKQPEFTAAHAKQLVACSQSLRRAAHKLETLSSGVEDHLADGVSLWVGSPGNEQPVLL